MFIRGESHALLEEAGGAGAGSGGGAGTGAGAGTGSGSGAPAGTGAPAAAAAPWHGIADPDVSSYVENKGWKTPADIVTGYQNAEKLIGRDPNTLLTVPKADDVAGLRNVFTKLGMPETADKYEIDGADKGDPAYVGWVRDTFHKIGLTAAQAKALTAEHNKFVQAGADKEVSDYNLKLVGEKQQLATKWGAGFERMLAAGKAAASGLGFSADVVNAIESKVGYAKTHELFAEIGKKLGEDKFVSQDGGKPGAFGMLTPDEAKADWEAMKSDPIMSKALTDNQHPNHKAATQKQARLFAIMYPS